MWFSRNSRGRVTLASSLALLLGASGAMGASAPERTLFADPPRALADVALTSHEGKPLRLSELRGAPVLLFFGFTRCPSVCPAALQQLRLLETMHKRELGRTRIVIVSVDGERDTPEAMAKWLGAVSPSFIGLTGAPDRVRKLAEQFSAAFFKANGSAAQGYLVEHNAQIFLIDDGGRLRATFFSAPVAVVAQVTASIAKESPRERLSSVAR